MNENEYPADRPAEPDKNAAELDCAQQGAFYEDEPIRWISRRPRKSEPPIEYRQMRCLARGATYSTENNARIFYIQTKFMEDFTDDCPYDGPVSYYFTSYQLLTLPELRGYFTWRTRVRRGELSRTSLSYAYLYIYELIHGIGSATKEEGFARLRDFYERYGAIDGRIRNYTKRWLVDYVIYYNLPAELVRGLADVEFDAALSVLLDCGSAGDDALFPAILRLSSYNPSRSKALALYHDEFAGIVCAAYRRINARYAARAKRPYIRKFCGNPVMDVYRPFYGAVFFDQQRTGHYEYRLDDMRRYVRTDNSWMVERGFSMARKSREIGALVRAADRLLRENHGLKPALRPAEESPGVLRLLAEAIEELKKSARPEISFDLSRLSGIRSSSDAVARKLMTEEERGEERPFAPVEPTAAPSPEPAARPELTAEPSPASAGPAPAECPLSGDELDFTRLLLDGGDWRGFLAEKRLMLSIVAEAVNERLYDEFADNVIEFDGDTPVIVEDYRDDLKGMISS